MNKHCSQVLLGYPSINERLKIVSGIMREDLQKYLELQKKVLQAQLEIDAKPNKGAKTSWSNRLSALEKKSLESKKPIIHFLNSEIFDVDLLKPVFRKVTEVFIFTYPEKGLRKLLEQIDSEKKDFMKLIEHVLKGDEKSLISYANKFEVEASLLVFLINTTIQPLIEDISRRVSHSFYEKWWSTSCPICGRIPNVARIRNRLRYLMCNFCGAEYLSDYFICANCGNKDPYTLKYMKIEGKPEYQIDFCTKCKYYVKVIIENMLKEPISRCVEDILTLELDIQAKHADLLASYEKNA